MIKCLVRLLFVFLMSLSLHHYARAEMMTGDTIPGSDSLDQINEFYDLAYQYRDSDVDKAIGYNKQALKLANENRSKAMRAKVNKLMGELFEKKNNFQPAINYYLIAAKIFLEIDDKKNLVNVYSGLGDLYYKNNYDLDKSNSYFQRALDKAIQLGDQELIADVYNRLGGVFFNRENFVEAGHYFKKANEIWMKTGSRKGEAIALNNLAEIYRLRNKPDKALELYKQSLDINRELGNQQNMAINLENIGLIKSRQKKTKEAYKYFTTSLGLFNRINDIENKVELLILMGNESLKTGNYQEAEISFRKALDIAVNSQHWIHIAQSSLGLSRTMEAKSDFYRALQYYKTYNRYSDSITLKKKREQLAYMKNEFVNSIREKEIESQNKNISLLDKERKVNLIQRNLLVILMVFVVMLAVFIIVRLRQQNKKEKLLHEKDAQLHKAQHELMALKLKSKEHDLTNFALHLVEKNKLLRELSLELQKLAGGPDDKSNRKMMELNNHIKQGLHIQQDVKEFQNRVDESYHDFFVKLKEKYPTLTKNEERLCALLRLKLSSKEIAELNNSSLKAVEMSRYRLRKKCGLEFNELLTAYLQQF